MTYNRGMHTAQYPPRHNDPQWEYIFLSWGDARIDMACQVWFAQWCKLDMNTKKQWSECLTSLHALSNRTKASLNDFIERLDDINDPFRRGVGYWSARSIFTAAIVANGWEGFAIRCATDPKGYAGYMQYIENNCLYAYVDDLPNHPYAGKKLAEALDLYGQNLAYPWVQAACIRWALFGKDTDKEDIPKSFLWLKSLYRVQQEKPHWNVHDVLDTTIAFDEHYQVIFNWLESSGLWMHMLLQESDYGLRSSTIELWFHWADSIRYPSTNMRSHREERDYAGLVNCMLGGDKTELGILQLMTVREYLLQRAKRHRSPPEQYDLPTAMSLCT